MTLRYFCGRGLTLLVLLVTLSVSGCGALWDAMYPPPPDPRATVGFYIAKTEPSEGWLKRTTIEASSVLYLAQEPIVTGTDIRSATPMTDPAGYFFVAIRLNDSGTRKLAQASARAAGDRLALIINNRLLGSAPIDTPIDKGLFAMATRDRSSAITLAQALSAKSKRR